MDSSSITSAASFVGVVVLISLVYKKVLNSIGSGIDQIKGSSQDMEKKLQELLINVEKREKELEQVKISAQRKIKEVTDASNKMIEDERKKMDEYYIEKKKEMKLVLEDFKKNSINTMQKELIQKALQKNEDEK